MLATLSLLSVANIQAIMAESQAELVKHSNVELLHLSTDLGLTPPEVLQEQDPEDLDEDQRQSLILEIAIARADRFLDDIMVFPEPWETLSDVVRTSLLEEASGRIDTREERQALWDQLQQIWDRIGDNVRARRERRQARRAERAQG